MVKKIFSSPTIMTWISYFVRFGSTIFVLPLILLKFPEAEIAVWFVFSLVIGLAQLADSGFGPSIVRSTSYYYAGSKHIPKNIKEFKSKKEINSNVNYNGLIDLLNTVNIVYIFLGFISVVVLMFVGEFIVSNSINMTDNVAMLNSAFYLIVIQAYVNLQKVKWVSFIQGVDKVASIQLAQSIINALNIIFNFLSLSLGYGIFALLAINLIFNLVTLFYSKYFVIKWFKQNEKLYSLKYNFNKRIFISIWPSTWRWGLMQYGGYLTNNGSAIVVSQLSSPTLIASFLLSQRAIFFIRQVSQAPLYANLPRIFQLMAKQDYKVLKPYCAKAIRMGLAIQFIVLLIMILIGPKMLDVFEINTKLAPLSVLLVMSVSIMLELHHAFHAQIYMGSNHVPFLLPAVLSGIAIVGISFGIVNHYGLIGIVIVQFLVQLSFNNWYPVYLNLKLLNWPFLEYIKCLFYVKKCN
jgi:hypothetical protein